MKNKVDIVAEERRATQEMRDIAHLIAHEINAAWADKSTELGKVGEVGYQVAVGYPHDWWESNCKNYKLASDRFKNDRDLHTVCLLAQALITE